MPRKTLLDAYHFPGFRPDKIIKGCFGDSKAFVITLKRRSKKQCVQSVTGNNPVFMTTRLNEHGIFPAGDAAFILSLKCAGSTVSGAIR
jgi:hypothetical protein